MMNTNHSYGFWSRRSGHGLIRSMPVAKWYASGYKISNQHVFELLTREMYGARRKIARAFDSFYESKLNPCYACHIYGTNWRGESTSWLHKLLPPKPFLFSQGRAVGNKLEYLSRHRFTIAFENYSGDRGYVSEKNHRSNISWLCSDLPR